MYTFKKMTSNERKLISLELPKEAPWYFQSVHTFLDDTMNGVMVLWNWLQTHALLNIPSEYCIYVLCIISLLMILLTMFMYSYITPLKFLNVVIYQLTRGLYVKKID